jgi:hypothetical protein
VRVCDRYPMPAGSPTFTVKSPCQCTLFHSAVRRPTNLASCQSRALPPWAKCGHAMTFVTVFKDCPVEQPLLPPGSALDSRWPSQIFTSSVYDSCCLSGSSELVGRLCCAAPSKSPTFVRCDARDIARHDGARPCKALGRRWP